MRPTLSLAKSLIFCWVFRSGDWLGFLRIKNLFFSSQPCYPPIMGKWVKIALAALFVAFLSLIMLTLLPAPPREPA